MWNLQYMLWQIFWFWLHLGLMNHKHIGLNQISNQIDHIVDKIDSVMQG